MITMLPHRSIGEIQQTIYQYLQADRTGLFDSSQGSMLYTLTRAIATIHADFDQRLISISRDSNIVSAEGDALDNWADLYGFVRRSGRVASGNVIVTSTALSSEVLGADLIAIEPESMLQYRFNLGIPVTISNTAVYTVPIVAVEAGSRYNLSSGTQLILSGYPDLFIRVGTHSLEDGTYCGLVSGGIDEESDLELRLRLLSKIQYGITGNALSIRSYLLSNPLISWVSFENVLLGSGLLRCWIVSPVILTSSQLKELSNSITDLYLPAGHLCEVVQAVQAGLNLDIGVVPLSIANVDMNVLKSSIISSTQSYLNSLDYGKAFEPTVLAEKIKTELGLVSAVVYLPKSKVVPIKGEVFNLRDLDVRIDIV